MFRAVSILFFSSSLVYASNYGDTTEDHYEPYHPPEETYYHHETPAPYVDEYVPPTYETEPTYAKPYDFVAPADPYTVHHVPEVCNETCQPNSARYMSYVCTNLYASALEWSTENCKAYYANVDESDSNSLYQAKLCSYWSEKSVLNVVSSCFMESHLRNEFITKYGKDGPGVWYCKYKDFINQVNECYGGSLKYYPLGESMNSIEQSVAQLYVNDDDNMPAFKFTGSSVAMCAYYNKDQVQYEAGV